MAFLPEFRELKREAENECRETRKCAAFDTKGLVSRHTESMGIEN
jgi:hypothetical protein